MLKDKKSMILTAVIMTTALGLSQSSFAMEMESPADNTAAATPALDTSKEIKLHPIVRSTNIIDDEYSDPENYMGYVMYAQLQYPKVFLQADEASAFPELDQALNDYYDTLESKSLEHFEECKAGSREHRRMLEQDGQLDFFTNYSNTETADVVRADQQILSIRDYVYSFEGGVHGYYTRAGATFDTQTGKKLAFTDVITDPAAAAKYTFEKIRTMYPDLEPFMSEEEVANSYQENSDLIIWTLEPSGMMIYFPPYMLGSYAEGMQAILLSYKEYPELFAPEYVPDSSDWIVPVDSLCGIQADLGNGTSVITVSGTQDEYGQYTDRVITVDNTPYTFDEDSLYYYSTDAYLVSSGGKFWLWCFDSMDNDYVELVIYSFENGLPSDTVASESLSPSMIASYWGDTSSYSDSVSLTDPQNIELSKRMAHLGTYDASKTYFVSGSGTPISEELFFTPSVQRQLTLKVPLSLKMVGQDGTGETMKEWPAGTTCTILRTDGNQIVDLVMNDDKTQVARVVGDFSQWPHQISGMDESDVFDGVMYAG